MSWNIEILCARAPGLELDGAVPDVFGPTGEHHHFEDATSVMRDGELCAARIGEWIVVIDVGCRVSGNAPYLREISTGRDVHVFRIAGAPLHLHLRDGRTVAEHRGLAACVAALTGPVRAVRDGELVAQDLLREQTGLGFEAELWDADYVGFAVD